MRALTPQEREELKQLVLPLIGDLHRVALRLCREQHAAEDLVADSIAKACESFHRLRERDNFKAWLLRILSNTFITRYRALKRHPHIEYEENHDDDHYSIFTDISQPFLLWWGNPERELVARLLDEDIRAAIESLPPEYRLAVVLCDVEGMTYEEIASTLDIPVGTVRSRLARGRSILQKKLRHHALEHGIIKSRTPL